MVRNEDGSFKRKTTSLQFEPAFKKAVLSWDYHIPSVISLAGEILFETSGEIEPGATSFDCFIWTKNKPHCLICYAEFTEYEYRTPRLPMFKNTFPPRLEGMY